jgi:hypothetical protein
MQHEFYQLLLSGQTTLQDVSDEELKILRDCWMTDDTWGLLPTEEIWDKALTEQNRRKIEAVTKHVAEQKARRKDKFSKGFYS